MISTSVHERSAATGSRLRNWARVSALCLVMAACGRAGAQSPDIAPVGPVADPPAKVADLLTRLEEAQVERERIQAELAELSVPELVDRLDADSQAGLEPFNSLVFREVELRGEAISDEFADLIRARGRPSFLSILALRAVNQTAYRATDAELVVDVLVDNLQSVGFFNAWGLPHLYWDVAALALIEQGKAAIRPLEGLLGDERRAPVYGSEEAIESERFDYRVKDYAFALIMAIQNNEIELPTDQSERDSLIQELIRGG